MRKRLAAALFSLLALFGCQSTAVQPEAVAPPNLSGPSLAQAPTNHPSASVRAYTPPPSQRSAAKVTPAPQQSQHAYAYPKPWYPSVSPRPWKYIVIHHSDTDKGSAASFDRYHREVRHWESLGYDFVIGNGNGCPDGQIEVGPRWTYQQVGAHAGVKEFNETGIGICLVGNFDQTKPSSTQMRSVAQLVAFLMKQYHIPPDHVIGHHEAKHGATNCPGRNMNLAYLRQMAASYAGIDYTESPAAETLASSPELLKDLSDDSQLIPQ